ncbi:MAG: flagellar hook-associated protein FlgK [Alphaproteobacteria bacterium]
MGISSLDSALSGLRINQAQIDVIANNVANAGTEGYTRKILPQSSQVVDGRSVGVLGETVIRNVDIRLQRDLWTQVSRTDFYNVQTTYLNRVEQFHGSPDANISIAAEVSKLQDSFAALANAPGDPFLLSDVVDQAQDTVSKISDLTDHYSTLMNDAQNEADVVVQSINDLLVQIAELNSQIRFSRAIGSTVAATEDARDKAIQDLSQLMELSTFSRGDGVVVVQTLQGIQLAADQAEEIFFRPTPLSSQSSYPDNVAGIYVGDPTVNANAIEITERNIGGKLGGLIELRDKSFPKMIAQIDELAHKMALRFAAQGLRLFTDRSGGIPSDDPPDTSTDPVIPVAYVGFASEIQVNRLIVDDHNLIQTGTYGGSIQTGANDIIRRIVEFTFGDVGYQTLANSDAATSVDVQAAATGATTLQNWLGLTSESEMVSGLSLSNYASIADMLTAGGVDAFGLAPNETDTFIIRFDDPDIGGGPYDMEIDLSAVPSTGTNAAQDLVDYITADGDWASAVADFGASVVVNSSGQLVMRSRSNIEVVNSPIDPISDLGFSFVGFSESLVEAQDPYFDVQVGNNAPVRIVIDPLDTETELLAKLNAVDGLAAQIDADGFLTMRPGNSFTNPDFGGDLNIIGGPFTTSGATLAGTAAGRASIDDGVNIAQALFGTYQVTGAVVEQSSPIVDFVYQSETEVGSGVFVSFRDSNLGAGANTLSEINQSRTLKDYANKVVNEVALELSLVQARNEDESSLRGLLEQQLLNESAVNIDEELGHLIVVQTGYSASARVISAVQEIFDELMTVI